MPSDKPDIRRASLPEGAMYGESTRSALLRSRVVQPAWTLLHALHRVDPAHNAVPLSIADAPLLWTRDGEGARLLSNACTHRGALVCEAACKAKTLRCRYHGRRFDLQGRLKAAPGFENALDFPSASDDLPAALCAKFGPWTFGAVRPTIAFDRWIQPLRERMAWYDFDALRYDPARDRDYEIDIAWPLYIDNYLEGFHVPFVHPELSDTLDLGDYRVETLDHAVLQVGVTDDSSQAFDLPTTSPEHGQCIAAYYWWLFPNLMINIYPWGVSLNLVDDLGPRQTRIRYRSWVSDPSRLDVGAGGALDLVEQQDQAVVRSAQRGVLSPLYTPGRYAPEHEAGTFHFHQLLRQVLSRDS